MKPNYYENYITKIKMTAPTHIPVVNRGTYVAEHLNGNKAFEGNYPYYENLRESENSKWGELLAESEATGETIYEIIAQRRAEARADIQSKVGEVE